MSSKQKLFRRSFLNHLYYVSFIVLIITFSGRWVDPFWTTVAGAVLAFVNWFYCGVLVTDGELIIRRNLPLPPRRIPIARITGLESRSQTAMGPATGDRSDYLFTLSLDDGEEVLITNMPGRYGEPLLEAIKARAMTGAISK
jgi:hypothetical protein